MQALNYMNEAITSFSAAPSPHLAATTFDPDAVVAKLNLTAFKVFGLVMVVAAIALWKPAVKDHKVGASVGALVGAVLLTMVAALGAIAFTLGPAIWDYLT